MALQLVIEVLELELELDAALDDELLALEELEEAALEELEELDALDDELNELSPPPHAAKVVSALSPPMARRRDKINSALFFRIMIDSSL